MLDDRLALSASGAGRWSKGFVDLSGLAGKDRRDAPGSAGAGMQGQPLSVTCACRATRALLRVALSSCSTMRSGSALRNRDRAVPVAHVDRGGTRRRARRRRGLRLCFAERLFGSFQLLISTSSCGVSRFGLSPVRRDRGEIWAGGGARSGRDVVTDDDPGCASPTIDRTEVT